MRACVRVPGCMAAGQEEPLAGARDVDVVVVVVMLVEVLVVMLVEVLVVMAAAVVVVVAAAAAVVMERD